MEKDKYYMIPFTLQYTKLTNIQIKDKINKCTNPNKNTDTETGSSYKRGGESKMGKRVYLYGDEGKLNFWW